MAYSHGGRGLTLGIIVGLSIFFAGSSIGSDGGYPAPDVGCLSQNCHASIEPIRAHDSGMAKKIYDRGGLLGDPNGCVVCHGGNPKETQDKKIAHSGAVKGGALDTYVPFPGSMWINDKTCGQCHPKHVYSLHRSVMQTEAGKIQGGLWGWGAPTGYDHPYGNYDIDDPDGSKPIYGTKAYSKYTLRLRKKFPNLFPKKLKKVPQADLSTIEEKPEQAILTYLRADCQRCHVGIRGRKKRGDMRGMGCAACHLLYSNEGFYEGGDVSIPKDKPGHILVHSIQATREAKVTVNNKTYSGIRYETCVTCHNRGKRIGVSFQGLMEFPYGTPFNDGGNKQPKLHTKKYLYIQDDHHHSVDNREGNPEGGVLCQDCHTTNAVHGNGNISTTTLANVEIECSDCHGTPERYPWELPLGFGDEFGVKLEINKPRGVATTPLAVQKEFGTVYPVKDGYLLTTRGNPFGNVVREGEKVKLHTASGLSLEIPTLKSIVRANSFQNPKFAYTAMVKVKKHLGTMECYSCHSAWAPQCYGCHVKVDYSGGKKSVDWVETGNTRFPDGRTADSNWEESAPKQPGKVSESRSYLRWEYPVLGVNGEGRVTPIIPGCQQITTVIGPDGKTLVNSKIWRTPSGLEGGGEEGQRGLDMTPAQPHTVRREARTCITCHGSSKALGYGIYDGRFMKRSSKNVYVDAATVKGELLTSRAEIQIAAIPDLPMDLDQVVTREGKQLQTVGHHWPDSRPLNQEQRDNMERVGVCIGCHFNFPEKTAAIAERDKMGRMVGKGPITDVEHEKLLKGIFSAHVFGSFSPHQKDKKQ